MAKIYIKNAEQIEGIRKASKLAAEVLDYVAPFVKPGVSTGELDKLCHEFITDHGAVPAPLNYCPPGYTPYPKATCISLNDVVCHGIPNFNKLLKKGDTLNIDITVIKDGYYGDTSRMYFAGEPSIMAKRLSKITYECMWLGINEVKPGRAFRQISDTSSSSMRKMPVTVLSGNFAVTASVRIPRRTAGSALRPSKYNG